MKKYQKPMVKWMEIESEGMIAESLGISDTPAENDASAKGRYGNFDWDDDDFASEGTYSNPNVFDEN